MTVGSEGSMSINGFQSDLAVLINQSNSVLSSLRSVRQVDYMVSYVVSQNQNEFYHVNEARPSLLFTTLDTFAVKYRAEVLAQAKEAYEITKKSAEVVDKIEDVYWSVQQKGSGSAILYNG